MDDIFDWYDDSIEHRKTIANQLSLQELSTFYTTKVEETTAHFSQEFKDLVQKLLSPGGVCLDYYQENKIDTKVYPSKRIICDMEKLENIRKLVFS
jgi:hypothetical protein